MNFEAQNITSYFPRESIFVQPSHRHDICQNFYATAVPGAKILRKKRVNHDITQFAIKERKYFKMA